MPSLQTIRYPLPFEKLGMQLKRLQASAGGDVTKLPVAQNVSPSELLGAPHKSTVCGGIVVDFTGGTVVVTAIGTGRAVVAFAETGAAVVAECVTNEAALLAVAVGCVVTAAAIAAEGCCSATAAVVCTGPAADGVTTVFIDETCRLDVSTCGVFLF